MQNQYIEVEKARKMIKDHIFYTEKKEVSLLEAQNHYTAESITTALDVPSFDNSAMDGYGFRFEDLSEFTELKITKIIQAGIAENTFVLGKGEAVRIFTGAKIPEGVNTVIMQEKTRCNGEYIQFDCNGIKKGDHIRLKGSQTIAGSEIVKENTFVNHALIGFLAGFGIEKMTVFERLKIGLLYTGNELVEIGRPLAEGQIYNSNSYTLQAALAEINHHFSLIQHVEDTEKATVSAIQKSLDQVDIVLITGGISVGDYDYVKQSLIQCGVTELFYKIKQKPGKPLFFGKKGKKFVFALPGNPASVLSCYHQYVRPFLLGCFGRENFEHDQDFAVSETSVRKKNDQQTQFLKAYYSEGKVHVLNAQESYKMDSAALANCFLEFPETSTEIQAGEKVKIWKI